MTLAWLFIMTLFVAYCNGANDNFKGVATLFGSRSATYKAALTLATAATFAGAVASALLARALVTTFSGKGLVPDAVAASPRFLLAVAAGAGCTVLLANLLGLPVSTTHGLIGALAGAGWVAAGPALDLRVLGTVFLAPLVLSPVLAVALTVPLYRLLHGARDRLGVTTETCVCVGEAGFVPIARLGAQGATAGAVALPPPVPAWTASIGPAQECVEKYAGRLLGISAQRLLGAAHLASAGTVSFARGLNDTPKIVALLLLVKALDVRAGIVAVAVAMAIGGLLNARRVARTMSRKIARMNDGQAFTANLVTALLVVFASRLGMPVSTTHVAVGSIAGIGIVNGSAARRMLSTIVASWVLTLPLAALIGAAVAWLDAGKAVTP
jgi:inorganic phosphate transporter, PiT family